MRRLMFGAILAVACIVSATDADAQTREDFVFNVPIRIENTPALNGLPVQVVCSVRAYVGGAFAAVPNAAQNVIVGPTGYRGTVRLAITLPDGVRRTDVQDWSCSLMVQGARNSRGEIVMIPGPNVEAKVVGYSVVTGQAVASHNVDEQGNFTW